MGRGVHKMYEVQQGGMEGQKIRFSLRT